MRFLLGESLMPSTRLPSASSASAARQSSSRPIADHELRAIAWLHLLDADEVRLVWLRAERVRWKAIAPRFGVDRSTAWRRWTCALIKIAAHLNSADAEKVLQHNLQRQKKHDFV